MAERHYPTPRECGIEVPGASPFDELETLFERLRKREKTERLDQVRSELQRARLQAAAADLLAALRELSDPKYPPAVTAIARAAVARVEVQP
jgi:hypothetical protein